MLTKNNWITSNISEKKNNDLFVFDVFLKPYEFKEMSFENACTYTCIEINKHHKNLYLALSGGLDSEFILRTFHKNNIEITPIIVAFGNEEEYIHAFRVCNELNITPIILTSNEEQFLHMYYHKIYEPFDGIGYNATQLLFCARYVVENDGTLITGNHLLGDGDELISNVNFASANEWDFYTDHMYKECNNIDFLLYTPEIAYASLPKHCNTSWATYKSDLYQIKFRSKIRHRYSPALQNTISSLLNNMKRVKYYKTWTKDEISNIFERVKHE